jgi:hypothetical protein
VIRPLVSAVAVTGFALALFGCVAASKLDADPTTATVLICTQFSSDDRLHATPQTSGVAEDAGASDQPTVEQCSATLEARLDTATSESRAAWIDYFASHWQTSGDAHSAVDCFNQAPTCRAKDQPCVYVGECCDTKGTPSSVNSTACPNAHCP